MFAHTARLLIVLSSIAYAPRAASAAPADPAIIQTWLDRAVAAVSKIDEPEARIFAHYHLARVLGQRGDAKQALASAKQVTNPQQQLYALKSVAEAARQAGDEELCRQIVAVGKPAAVKAPGAFIDSAFVDVCFAAGLPEAALDYADATYRSVMDPGAYLKIVRVNCAGSDRAAAEKLIESKKLGDDGRLHMVQGFIDGKHFATAAEIVDSIDETSFADQARSQLAEAIAHTGDENSAMKHAEQIHNEARRRGTIDQVARFSSKDNSLEELRARFASAESREEKSGILPFLVQKLCAVGEFVEADQAIDETAAAISEDPQPDVISKFGTYGDKSATGWIRVNHLPIAKVLIERGERDRAAEQLAKASAALNEVLDAAAIVKGSLEEALVEALLAFDREEEAVAAMEKITGPSARARAAAVIAIYRIHADRIEDGLKLIAYGEGYMIEGSEIGDVALALLRTSSIEKAVAFLNDVESSDRSTQAFNQVARKLVEQDRIAQLEEIHESLDSPVAQAHLAMEAATRLLLQE